MKSRYAPTTTYEDGKLSRSMARCSSWGTSSYLDKWLTECSRTGSSGIYPEFQEVRSKLLVVNRANGLASRNSEVHAAVLSA